jgi:hypothetical protein
MSAIRIAKGYPISLLISVKQDGTLVNVNDGTWTYNVSLHFQTYNGPIPFNILSVANGSRIQVDLDDIQTTQLNHLSTGYVLVVSCSKNDGSAFIKNEVPVSVTDGL